jgi:hypothetical protein
MRFRIFRTSYLFAALILAAWLASIVVGGVIYGDGLDRWMASVGISHAVAGMPVIGGGVALWVGGTILVSAPQRKQAKRLVDFDQTVTVRLTKEDGGRRSLAHDGVVVVHGIQAFLDTAFADAGQWVAIIREIYCRLDDKAQSASGKYIRPVLDGGANKK